MLHWRVHTNRRGRGSPAAGLDKALSTFRVEHCGGAWATDSFQRDRRNRARTTIFAITAGKNYAHVSLILGWPGNESRASKLRSYQIRAPPTHVAYIAQGCTVPCTEARCQRQCRIKGAACVNSTMHSSLIPRPLPKRKGGSGANIVHPHTMG